MEQDERHISERSGATTNENKQIGRKPFADFDRGQGEVEADDVFAGQ